MQGVKELKGVKELSQMLRQHTAFIKKHSTFNLKRTTLELKTHSINIENTPHLI